MSLASSPQRLEQHEAEGGWRGRVKVLAASSFGAAATKEQGAAWLCVLSAVHRCVRARFVLDVFYLHVRVCSEL